MNVHLHMLVLDGVYVNSEDPAVAPTFRKVPAPTAAQLHRVLTRISRRIGRYLERRGLLAPDPEHDYLQLDALDEQAACMDRLRGHSITYRIALTECGHVRYTLKTPYRDGTTHVSGLRSGETLTGMQPVCRASLGWLVRNSAVILPILYPHENPSSSLRLQEFALGHLSCVLKEFH